jgi:leucyl aminopeptidase
MKFNTNYESNLSNKTDVLFIPIFEKEVKIEGVIEEINKQLSQSISNLIISKDISGKKDTMVPIFAGNQIGAKYVIFIGLGLRKDFQYDDFRMVMGNLIRIAKKYNAKQISINMEEILKTKLKAEKIMQAISEGIILGNYSFKKYKTKKDDTIEVQSVDFFGFSKTLSSKLKNAVALGKTIAESVNFARDLENLPSNDLTPSIFVDIAKEKLKSSNIIIEIIDENKAKKLGMNLFLSVAKGSIEKPYMLILKHLPKKDEKAVCLVGKGITFDSGGISIKPSKGMDEMKADMCGAATVLATIVALEKLGYDENIIGIMPLCENMPSGAAVKPGDIIKAYNGKTIEILNTDAEGRLILADALAYGAEQNISEIIDFATLTGACTIALGDICTAIIGNNKKMISKFLKCSEFSGEMLWQLPCNDKYLDYLKSDNADISNIGAGRNAGTITAAKFLEQFVNKKPWVHFDIASTSKANSTKGYLVKGMTGVGVRNILEYLIK